MKNPQSIIDNDNSDLVQNVRSLKTKMLKAERVRPGQSLDSLTATGNFPEMSVNAMLSASGNTTTLAPKDNGIIMLYNDDGTGWVQTVLAASVTISSAGYTSGFMYDLFIYSDQTADPPAHALESIIWTSETARSVALVAQDGAYLKSTDLTRRFIGTARYNGSTLLVAKYDPNGEIIFGTGDPRNNVADPATGVWMSAPGITIGSYIWQFAAILAGVVGVGFNDRGQLVAGAGAVFLDKYGQAIKATGLFSSFDNLALTNGAEIGSLELIPAAGLGLTSFTVSAALTVPDPGFEVGGGDWTYIGGASASTAQYRSGTHSLKLPGGVAATAESTAFINVTGKSLLLDFWVYSAGASAVDALLVTIECYTSGGVSTGTGNTVNVLGVSSNGIWTRFQLMGTYPTSTAKVKLLFGGNLTDIYVDDISAYDGTGYQATTGLSLGSPAMVIEGAMRLTRGIYATVGYLTSLTLTSFLNEYKGADIASASTTDIGAATGNYINVTGTVTITALGTVQAGTRRIVQFSGALTLTHNATSLILPGSANITTVAGDVATFVSLGSGNWKCTSYQKATITGSGSGVLATSPTLVTPNIGAATATSLAASGAVTGSNLSGTNTGDQTIKSLIGANLVGATIALSTTTYLAPFTNQTDTVAKTAFSVSFGGAAGRLFVRLISSQPASGSLVVTVFQNGVGTALTVTIAAGSGAANYSDVTHTFTQASGDRITFEMKNNATAVSGGVAGVGFEVDA